MIVTTTPTGDIGGQLVTNLLERTAEPVRVVVRDPSRLAPGVRERVEVVAGSHGDRGVIDRALDGADALFWLVPPDPRAGSVESAYVGFSTPAVEALAAHGVTHVVGISALGRGTPVADRAGLVTATLAADDLFATSGAAYRALACAGFMDNVLRQVAAIREGTFRWPLPAERRLPVVATADIAAAATELLVDRSWSGVGDVALTGPEEVTPEGMVRTMSEVLGQEIAYREQTLDEVASATRTYAAEPFADAMVAMMWAKQHGLDDGAQRSGLSGSTTFRRWCEQVLRARIDG